jgi:hypothetical protein
LGFATRWYSSVLLVETVAGACNVQHFLDLRCLNYFQHGFAYLKISTSTSMYDNYLLTTTTVCFKSTWILPATASAVQHDRALSGHIQRHRECLQRRPLECWPAPPNETQRALPTPLWERISPCRIRSKQCKDEVC